MSNVTIFGGSVKPDTFLIVSSTVLLTIFTALCVIIFFAFKKWVNSVSINVSKLEIDLKTLGENLLKDLNDLKAKVAEDTASLNLTLANDYAKVESTKELLKDLRELEKSLHELELDMKVNRGYVKKAFREK